MARRRRSPEPPRDAAERPADDGPAWRDFLDPEEQPPNHWPEGDAEAWLFRKIRARKRGQDWRRGR